MAKWHPLWLFPEANHDRTQKWNHGLNQVNAKEVSQNNPCSALLIAALIAVLRHSPIPAEHRHNSIRQGQDIVFRNKVIKYSVPMTLWTPRVNAWSVHLADSATHESVCMYMRALARALTHTHHVFGAYGVPVAGQWRWNHYHDVTCTQEYITPQSVQRLIQLCIGSWSSGIGSLRHNTVHIWGEPGESRVLLDQKQWCPTSRPALRWCGVYAWHQKIRFRSTKTLCRAGSALHTLGGYVLLMYIYSVCLSVK